ncbi:MAG: tetratricopeptide repeat protein, partial [Chitinophagales bacterium]|nr:tetratricopeptide repeat protein [Chitinophagales bacterium]
MKVIFTLLFLFIVNLFANGQDLLGDKFEKLYHEGNYDKIISCKVKKKELTAVVCYYIGISYCAKQRDKKALYYLDMAIKKGPVHHDMYFFKARVLYYLGRYEESLPYFDKAILLRPNEPDFYSGKGESFYALENIDSAIVYFEKASKFPKCKSIIYAFMGEIYQTQKKIANAISAYKTVIKLIDQSNDRYQRCSFNL